MSMLPPHPRSPAAEDVSHKRPELRNLTSVRFVAAAMVVLFHIRDSLPAIVVNGAVEIGYVGVSFFFVLSGFILAYNHSASLPDREFWKARLARIYPVYLVGLLLSLPFFAVLAVRGEVSWGALVAALLLVQAWVPGFALALNAPGWSLSDEAFFYAMFPAVMHRLRGMTVRGAVWSGAAAWIAGLAVPVVYLAVSGGRDIGAMDHGFSVQAVKFGPPGRLGEFIAGMAAGVVFLRLPRTSRPALTLAAAAVVAVLVSLASRIPYLVLHNGLFAPAFVALIFGLATTDVPLLASRVFVRLGEASYSLYILHAPIWMVVTAVEKRQHLLGRALPAVYLGLSLVISLLAYRYIEVPMRARLRSTGGAMRRAGADAERVAAPRGAP
jgi:peptidoglycan/LPS O-acetylase OafA/YrhL